MKIFIAFALLIILAVVLNDAASTRDVKVSGQALTRKKDPPPPQPVYYPVYYPLYTDYGSDYGELIGLAGLVSLLNRRAQSSENAAGYNYPKPPNAAAAAALLAKKGLRKPTRIRTNKVK